MRRSVHTKVAALHGVFLAGIALCAAVSRADLIAWETAAGLVASNVSVGTNSGAGWTLDGTAGVEWDYGALDSLEGKPIDGSTVEFIFNYQNVGISIAIGTVSGWSPGNEQNEFKVEQWNNTGKYGITIEGIVDYTLTTDSTFNVDTHVVFVRNSSGIMDMYLNGVSLGQQTNKTNWRMDGGVGRIGSRSNGTVDVATGTAFGVASYDTALSASDISALYDAYIAAPVPEPSSLAVAGIVVAAGCYGWRRHSRSR